jgi:nucleoside-diphosphate-sugar epimerase
MKVLVSGATGFIGGHLVTHLLKSGFDVAILTRTNSSLEKILSFKKRVQIFESDTYEDIYFGIKKFTPHIVIHLAAFYIKKHTSKDIFDLINSNIIFGTYILEAIAENGGGFFLNFGTRWQHIGNKRYNPANIYAATKESFKCILRYYENKNIAHKTIELCDTYGDKDSRMKIFDLLISACQNKTPLDLSPGKQILDLSFVDDICQFIISNINDFKFFDNGNLSLCGTTIKLSDLGTLIENKFGVHGLLKWGAKPYRENEIMNPPLYYHKIQLKKYSLEKYITEKSENYFPK